jgi:hypothetical protein
LQSRIVLVDMSSTVSPNMLGWDGRRKNGDPDNSALHSSSHTINYKSALAVVVSLTLASALRNSLATM